MQRWLGLKRLPGDQCGTATIELAVAVPLLGDKLLGAYDISNAFVAQLKTEQVAQRVAELAVARRPVGENTQYLVDEARRLANAPSDVVDVELYLECDGVRQASYATACQANQQIGRFVDISIRRTYEPVFDYQAMAAMFGSRGPAVTGIRVVGDANVRLQ